MKFYDNYGNVHKSVVKAKISGITKKVDNKLKEKLPGYEETFNAFNNIKSFEDDEEDLELFDEDVAEYFEDKECVKNDYVEETEGEDNTSTVINEESEESIRKTNTIEIDYLNNLLKLKDRDNNVIAKSPIDDKLTSTTLDKLLVNTLYPNGVTPDDENFVKGLRNKILIETDPRIDENYSKVKDNIIFDEICNKVSESANDSLSNNKG